MKTLTQLKIASILVMLLGLVHLCATPVIFQLFNPGNHPDLASVYMFVMVGISTFFFGWIQFFVIKKMNNDRVLLAILKASVLFMCILGAGAVATMWDNPFAYTGLLVALYELILLKYINTTN